MTRSVVSGVTFALCVVLLSPPARAAGRELVIADEGLAINGERLPGQLDALCRRIETLAKWPKGSLKGKAFVHPAEAMAYIKAKKPAFALLPSRDLIRASAENRFKVVGQGLPLDLYTESEFHMVGIALKQTPISEHVHLHPDLRLAMVDSADRQWVRVVFDGTVDPYTHFNYVKVDSDDEAIKAVEDKRADFAMLSERGYKKVSARLDERGDLKVVFATPDLPPWGLVAFDKVASAGDTKKLEGVLDQLCINESLNICTRMGFIQIKRAENPTRFENWFTKYRTYK